MSLDYARLIVGTRHVQPPDLDNINNSDATGFEIIGVCSED